MHTNVKPTQNFEFNISTNVGIKNCVQYQKPKQNKTTKKQTTKLKNAIIFIPHFLICFLYGMNEYVQAPNVALKQQEKHYCHNALHFPTQLATHNELRQVENYRKI